MGNIHDIMSIIQGPFLANLYGRRSMWRPAAAICRMDGQNKFPSAPSQRGLRPPPPPYGVQLCLCGNHVPAGRHQRDLTTRWPPRAGRFHTLESCDGGTIEGGDDQMDDFRRRTRHAQVHPNPSANKEDNKRRCIRLRPDLHFWPRISKEDNSM